MPIADSLNLKHYLGLVRFSHTLFAMPFALASMVWAAQGLPGLRPFLLIVLCMVTCRNAAMAFNRLIDADIDGENPRTARRHLPAGILSRGQVMGFLIINAVVFIAATWFVNRLAFALSVPALVAVCGYSVTKRFTSLSHFFLGLAIGISPVGAWIAVRGSFAWEPILLCLALLLWIAGFDIIYATQDHEFDRKKGLHSLVVRLGVKGRASGFQGLPPGDVGRTARSGMVRGPGRRLCRLPGPGGGHARVPACLPPVRLAGLDEPGFLPGQHRRQLLRDGRHRGELSLRLANVTAGLHSGARPFQIRCRRR